MALTAAREALADSDYLAAAETLIKAASATQEWRALARTTTDELWKTKQSGPAILLSKRWTELFPQDSTAHFMLGRCQARAAQLSAAQESFKAVIDLDPTKPAGYLALSKVQIGAFRPDDAIATLAQGAAAIPDDIALRRELLQLLVRSKRFAEATKVADQALKLAPEDPDVRYFAARVLLYAGRRLPLARKWLEGEVERRPDQPTARLYLSALCADLDDEVAARRHYQGVRRSLVKTFIGGRKDASQPRVLVIQSLEAGHFTVTERHAPTLRGGHAGVEFVYSLKDVHRVTIAIDGKRDQDLLARLVDHSDLVVNTLADPELLPLSLSLAEEVLEAPGAPHVVNPPSQIWPTARDLNARRLAGIDGLLVPKVARLSIVGCDAAGAIEAIEERGMRYPVAIRDAGTSTGQSFVRYESADDIRNRLPKRSGTDRFVIEWYDLMQSGGFCRRFRVFFVDNVLFPKSLHVGWDWNVHSKDRLAVFEKMPELRSVERDFVLEPESVLGAGGVAALHAINERVGLDYFAIDFDILDDGRLIFFEANAGVRNVPNPGIDPAIESAVSDSNRALERLIVERAITARRAAA